MENSTLKNNQQQGKDMKILKTNQFISERIKMQPVTNAELDKAQADILSSPKLNPIIVDNPYEFLSKYIDTKVLDAVHEIRILRTKNIELELRNDEFAIRDWGMTCTLYINSSKYCWRSWSGRSRQPVKRGPFGSAEEMLSHFAKWLEKKYDKMHQ